MTVHFFYGEEEYDIELALKSMRASLDSSFAAMNYRVYTNPNFLELSQILRTQPMMFGNMLMIINANGYFLDPKGGGFEDKQLAEIEELVKNSPELVDIVFVVKLPRGEGKKLDSRRKLYKILSKTNAREFASLRTYQTAELSARIKEMAKQKEVSIDNDACMALIEQIGNNLREFDAELEKLKLLIYPSDKIGAKLVRDNCISNQDLFNLTDYIMKNEKDRALLEFRRLMDKKHPLEILSAVQTMLKKWITLKLKSSSLSPFELSKLTGMHEFAVKQTLQKLKTSQLKDMVKLKQNLINAEYRIKNGQSYDVEFEVENALIR
jgi:DNA polymerase-3 subunit delta